MPRAQMSKAQMSNIPSDTTICFLLDGVSVEVDGPPPTTTLLRWLRETGRTGTKEGCGEGDCGACTVLLVDPTSPERPRAVNSCLVLLPQVHGLKVWTVQGLADGDDLHPAQAAMVEALGSQCGYCTPGFVMSLVEGAHRPELRDADVRDWRLDDQLCGNLCRCTGYRPIRDALRSVAGSTPDDAVAPHLAAAPADGLPGLAYAAGDARFLAPTGLDELVALRGAHPDARLVSGATDLGLEITKQHARFPLLIDVSRVADLRGVTPVHGGAALRIGAATPLSDVEAATAEALPVLHRLLRYFGSRQIKHRGTVGGNLCTASPIGDLAPGLLALDAVAEVVGPDDVRTVPMAGFFPGYRQTALRPDELLAAVIVPRPAPGTKTGAYKVSRRRELDISAVSAAFAVHVGDDGLVTRARLAFGGVAATPIRAVDAEAALVGRPFDADAVEAAVAALPAQVRPIDDHRGSAWFRRTVAANLLRGFLAETRDRDFVPLPPGHTGTVAAPADPTGGAR